MSAQNHSKSKFNKQSGMLTTYAESFDPQFRKPKTNSQTPCVPPNHVDDDWLIEVNRLRDLAEKFKIRGMSSSIWWDKDLDSPVNFYSDESDKDNLKINVNSIGDDDNSSSIPISYEVKPATQQYDNQCDVRNHRLDYHRRNPSIDCNEYVGRDYVNNHERRYPITNNTNYPPPVCSQQIYDDNPVIHASNANGRNREIYSDQKNNATFRIANRGDNHVVEQLSNNVDCLISSSPDYFIIPEEGGSMGNENNNHANQLSYKNSKQYLNPRGRTRECGSSKYNSTNHFQKKDLTIGSKHSASNPSEVTRRRVPLSALQTSHLEKSLNKQSSSQSQHSKPPSLVFKKENLVRLLKG